VYLFQPVAPGSAPTIALLSRDDEAANAHTWIELDPVQAMEIARLLGTAAAAAVTGRDHREP
jgi:hypothetical protein